MGDLVNSRCFRAASLGDRSIVSFARARPWLLSLIVAQRFVASVSVRLFYRRELHSAFSFQSCQAAFPHSHLAVRSTYEYRASELSHSFVSSPVAFPTSLTCIVLVMIPRTLCRASTGALFMPQRACCRVVARSYSLLRTSHLRPWDISHFQPQQLAIPRSK